VPLGGGGGNIKVIHYAGEKKPWMKDNISIQKRIKILSNIKHFDRCINYKQSVLYKIDQYYNEIKKEVDMM
jgi:lipopolysaccharide biosynthesis glycosyltransferase